MSLVLGTVLSIWSHPNDETVLSAGLMAVARDAGNRVVCVTATLGKHGIDNTEVRRPPGWAPSASTSSGPHSPAGSWRAAPDGGAKPNALLDPALTDFTREFDPPDRR